MDPRPASPVARPILAGLPLVARRAGGFFLLALTLWLSAMVALFR